MNLCFDVLDMRVINGEADAPALAGEAPMHVARLLEEVAALGGLFRGVGVAEGQPVGLHLADRRLEFLAVLACLRIGAHAVELRSGRLAEHRPALVLADAHLDLAEHTPGTVVLHGVEPQDQVRDLTLDVGLRAGRTDPAPSVDVPADALAWVLEGPVALADAADDRSRYGAWVRALAAGQPVDPTAVG